MRRIISILKDLMKGMICRYYWVHEKSCGIDWTKSRLSGAIGVTAALWYQLAMIILYFIGVSFNENVFCVGWLSVCLIADRWFNFWFFKSGRYQDVITDKNREKYDKVGYGMLLYIFIMLPVIIFSLIAIIVNKS